MWFADVAVIVVSAVAGAVAIRGARRTRTDRVAGLRLLNVALFINLLFALAFMFALGQFVAVFPLALVLILVWLVTLAQRRPPRGD